MHSSDIYSDGLNFIYTQHTIYIYSSIYFIYKMKSPCIVTHVIILTADVFVDIEEMVEFPGRNYSYVTMEGNVSVVEGQILLQPTVFEIALQEKSAQGKIIVFRVIRFNNLHFTL